MPLSFTLPPIHDNADGSWGPSSSTLPPQFKDIPYAPFSKSDKISRVADWHDPAELQKAAGRAGNYTSQANRRPMREAYGASEKNVFGYVHEEDEKSFSLVDSGRNTAARKGAPVRGGARGGGRGGFAANASTRGGALRTRGGFIGRSRNRLGRDKPTRIRDASVTIGPDWRLIQEQTFAQLAKLALGGVDEPEDLERCGMLQQYDKTFDRVNTRNEKPLEISNRESYNITTSDDPKIAKIAERNHNIKVFATDSILSVLMCAGRSINSWDMVLDRRGDQLFLDKRDGGVFDFLTVNENATDPPADSDDGKNINSASNLSLEASYINAIFASQVVVDGEAPYSPGPHPFYTPDEDEEPASCLYRYRKYTLPGASEDDDVEMVVRTETNAYVGKTDTLITVKALNEFESRATGSSKALDWRKNLDVQRGAIVASEMKNNSAKLARWAVQSILAGAEQMKLGYISRANPRDSQRHVIVGVQSYKPIDFARQMNVSLINGWGIVRTIVDLALKQPEGKYVLTKDPNNTIVRFYAVPENAFDADDATVDGE